MDQNRAAGRSQVHRRGPADRLQGLERRPPRQPCAVNIRHTSSTRQVPRLPERPGPQRAAPLPARAHRREGFCCGCPKLMTTSSRCWRPWQLTCISTMRAENSMNREPRRMRALRAGFRDVGSIRKNGQHGNPVSTLRSSHAIAWSVSRALHRCRQCCIVVMRVAEKRRGVQRLTNLAL